MSFNFFKKAETGLEDAVKWVAVEFSKLSGIAAKVELVLKAEKALAPDFITGVKTIVGDVITLLADANVVFTAKGLNIPADSSAYTAFEKLAADIQAFAPIVEKAIASL